VPGDGECEAEFDDHNEDERAQKLTAQSQELAAENVADRKRGREQQFERAEFLIIGEPLAGFDSNPQFEERV